MDDFKVICYVYVLVNLMCCLKIGYLRFNLIIIIFLLKSFVSRRLLIYLFFIFINLKVIWVYIFSKNCIK